MLLEANAKGGRPEEVLAAPGCRYNDTRTFLRRAFDVHSTRRFIGILVSQTKLQFRNWSNACNQTDVRTKTAANLHELGFWNWLRMFAARTIGMAVTDSAKAGFCRYRCELGDKSDAILSNGKGETTHGKRGEHGKGLTHV